MDHSALLYGNEKNYSHPFCGKGALKVNNYVFIEKSAVT